MREDRLTPPAGSPDADRISRPPLAQEAMGLRQDVLRGLYACGGGHYGGALSVLDIILTLYRTTLRVQPEAPDAMGRDRFILSKGHAAIALYAVLRHLGFFEHPLSEL